MSDILRQPRSLSKGSRQPDSTPVPITSMGMMNGVTLWAPLFSDMQAWAGQLMQFNVSLQQEWLVFVEKRLRRNAAFTQQLADCKGPDALMRRYSEFMRTAIEDYQNEFAALARIGSCVADETHDERPAVEGETEHPDTKPRHAAAPTAAAKKRSGNTVRTQH